MVLSARTAAIVGPVIWSVTVDQLRPEIGNAAAYKAAVGTVVVAMALALWVLRKVPDKRARAVMV
jgi:hypothetical protein